MKYLNLTSGTMIGASISNIIRTGIVNEYNLGFLILGLCLTVIWLDHLANEQN